MNGLAWNSGFTPILSNYKRDDIAVAENTLDLAAKQYARRRMTGGGITTNSTSYASLADLAVTVNRLGGTAFEYWLLYDSNDVGEGIGVQLAFSGSANGIAYSIDAFTAPNARANLVVATDFSTGIAPFATGPAASPCIINIRGSCFVTAVGDLNVQVRAETGGANQARVFSPSWGFVWAT